MKDILIFSESLRGALDELVQRITSSLVVVRGHRFGGGAGIIWGSGGLILTNQHVVGRQPPLVLLQDNREFGTHLVARDPEGDQSIAIPATLAGEFVQKALAGRPIRPAAGRPVPEATF